MEKIKKAIKKCSRGAILVFFVFIETGTLLALIYWACSLFSWLYTVLRILSLLTVIYIIGKRKESSVTLPWCILICLLPVFGSVMFYIFGNDLQLKRLVKKYNSAFTKLPENYVRKTRSDSTALISFMRKFDRRGTQTAIYLDKKCRFPAYCGGKTLYFPSGEDVFSDMIPEFEKAKKFIFIEFFIIEESKLFSKILSILSKKAASGVEVCIIYDDFGGIGVNKSGFAKEIEEQYKGIRCLRFNPLTPVIPGTFNCRNHRKTVVIDGKKAYTGGLNIADRYININPPYGYWKDCGIKIFGKAVDAYTLTFVQMWNAFRQDKLNITDYIGISENSGNGLIQPFFDSPISNECISKNVMLDLISKSKNYLYIFTPYLIPDDEIMTAIALAAKRGVSVQLYSHGIPDKKAVYRMSKLNYRRLLSSGVKISKFNKGFVHSKVMTADGKYALVGTANIDYRSLHTSFESGIYIQNEEVIEQLENDFKSTLKESVPLSSEDLKENILGKIIDSLISLVQALF